MNKQTFLVMGVAKSGTSMTAGLLRMMGVFMGDHWAQWENNVEDMEFAKHITHGQWAKYEALVKKRDEAHDVWGFKHPTLFTCVKETHYMYRNPKYIIMFRDPYATAMHTIHTPKDDPSILERRAKAMIRNAKYQSDMAAWIIERHGRDVLPVSYEKALTKPQVFLDRLIEFGGFTPSQRTYKTCLAYLEPNAGYKNIKEYIRAAQS